uniref:High affinity choline transporter 1-like n=1 Tax=Gouania willdenowi TaxID=441366 RepID=A0A8C5HM79_GOUWI
MAANWLKLLSIGVFYAIILCTGIWAARRTKREERRSPGSRSEVEIVGGRNLNIWVSILTITATWVGGGYILGVAEAIYNPTLGLVWTTAPIAYVLTFILGGLFFVKPIRAKNYVTLMDPFQEKYGNTIAAILFIPAILGDILWIACMFLILGGTVSAVIEISSTLSIGISASVAILYTSMGGLFSVAYTDVIQLGFMFVGLGICVPFVLTTPQAANLTVAAVTKLYQEPWIGKITTEDTARWIDGSLLLILGGLCYPAFYQRVLSTATDKQAQLTCYAGAALCPILAIPSIIIGAVAASTNWNQTSFGSPSPYEQGKSGLILPIALQHLCPVYVSVISTGALAAAVMSSADSALLSAASMLGRNIFKNIIYKKASEKMILVVIKVSVIVCGLIGAALALSTNSIYLLWIYGADVLYSMMTAQVICTFFLSQWINRYGVVSGFLLAMVLRTLVGEPGLGLPDLLPLPWDKIQDDGHKFRLFPFRTAIMLVTIITVLLTSKIAEWMLKRGLQKSVDKMNTNMDYIAPVQRDEEEEEKLNQTQT